MKILVIGGNRFVGLRVCHELSRQKNVELHVLNRTGQVAHCPEAVVFKGSRQNLTLSHLDRDYDVIVDFAGYSGLDIESPLNYFTKMKRYIFISSAAVYNSGLRLKETQFNAKEWDPSKKETASNLSVGTAYVQGKREAEAVLARNNVNAMCVRFPFILGEDDYTERLMFHVRQILAQKPIYLDTNESRFSVISSLDAQKFLTRAVHENWAGPINVAGPDELSVRKLMQQISLIYDAPAQFTKESRPETRSPYEPGQNWSLDVSLSESWGFKCRPSEQWLPQLISQDLTTPRGPIH